jgi:hypothetical protein
LSRARRRDHGRLLRAAGAERFALDRLYLNDDAPLSSEVERVRAALERVAGRKNITIWRECGNNGLA